MLSATAALAQTSYPMIMALEPVAVQAGASSEHTIASRYSMYGAYEITVTGEGVTGEVIDPAAEPSEEKTETKDPEAKAEEENKKKEKPNLQALKVRFTAASSAALGVRDFRLATPQGASTLGQLVVVRDPVIVEQSANDTVENAQPVSLPATLCGKIEKGEDVDFYKFTAQAGQTINFHVRSMRLQNRIHDLQAHVDPILTLRNASGGTLAASDNYFFGDPFISYRFDRGGEYLLEIRDVRYSGNGYWQYSIEISDRPFVTTVHPLGIPRGAQSSVELVGFGLPEGAQATLSVAADAPVGRQPQALAFGGESTNPVPMVVTDPPMSVETGDPNNTPGEAQPITAPGGISGRIEGEQDIDCYRFDAKKGDTFSFEVVARRARSALDSHLRVLDQEGKQLALADDMNVGKQVHADSWIEHWVAPADGTYVLEIRDLHLRGGPPFVYFIQVTPSQPYFDLYVDTDKTQLTPGTAGALFVRADRKQGFNGEIQLAVEGLPEGVTATCGKILAVIDKDGDVSRLARSGGPMIDGAIVLEAAEGAPLTLAQVTVTGQGVHQTDDGQSYQHTATAVPYQEIYQPGGGRGHWPSSSHVVSVGEPNDIRRVTLSTAEITLKPGESQKIEVAIERSSDYDKNITLDVIYQHLNSVFGNTLPRGVTLDAGQSKTLLDGKTSAGHVMLKAADDAPPVEKQLVPVMSHVSLNFVMKSTYAGKPLFVTVVDGQNAEKK